MPSPSRVFMAHSVAEQLAVDERLIKENTPAFTLPGVLMLLRESIFCLVHAPGR